MLLPIVVKSLAPDSGMPSNDPVASLLGVEFDHSTLLWRRMRATARWDWQVETRSEADSFRQDWYEFEIWEFGCYLPLAKVRNTRSLKLSLGSSTSNKVSQLLGLQWLDQSSPSRTSGSLYVPGHQKRPQLWGSRQTPDPGMKYFNLSCQSLLFSTDVLVLQLLIWSFAKKVHTTKVFASGSASSMRFVTFVREST